MWPLISRVLFQFDAEKVHRLSVAWMKAAAGLPTVRACVPVGGGSRPQALGMDLLSRVGLAAGFDKDAEVIHALPAFGFGFAEIGTVTPRPQPGNPKPRLFREAETRSVFNRMGFNSGGMDEARRNLERHRDRLPDGFRVGVNMGKNKDTPLEEAARDYVAVAQALVGLADYLVVNVSSPNTPGLRSLQTEASLRPIVAGVAEVVARQSRRVPLLLKLSPDLPSDELAAILAQAPGWGAEGWVLTNTLPGRWEREGGPLDGGWSGAPLQKISKNRLIEARKLTSLPIISVGGILSEADAIERLQSGADLIQVYSGWVFGGPRWPRRIARAIAAAGF
ncbi:MAG: quinone-dependent dihydroorotate dehydrogenase [Bacteriovoracia bacterium]